MFGRPQYGHAGLTASYDSGDVFFGDRVVKDYVLQAIVFGHLFQLVSFSTAAYQKYYYACLAPLLQNTSGFDDIFQAVC